MKPLITIENIGKMYSLGVKQSRHDTLGEVIINTLKSPLRRLKEMQGIAHSHDTIFWALKNVSFDIEKGDVVGIVGRNGAGKSTLLKILSKITDPTEGRIVINGRVSSLLEVGTGFHPDLTGRENIFLNGAILGMKQMEITRKFDEIVDFAEIEKFLDTPVKRYSSGMYVRLAFAVAAHLDPEILVVDEVLAVGDIAFQKKCLGKMESIAGERRTVLFVSHNLPMLRQLCPQSIWLEKGNLVGQGQSDEVISAYVKNFGVSALNNEDIRSLLSKIQPDPAFEFLDVRIFQEGQEILIVGNGNEIHVQVEYIVRQEMHGMRVLIDLLGKNDELLFRTFHDDSVELIPTVKPGRYISTAIIPANFLSPITYTLHIQATVHNVRMLSAHGVRFPLAVANTGVVNRAYVGDPIRGLLAPLIAWQTEQLT